MKRINSTRFLTQDELAEKLTALDMNGDSYSVGGIPLLVKDGKIYVDDTDSHTMIYGATGSKKTRMFAMPSIGVFARAGESFVVTDPKGELFLQTAGDVREHGYEVCCINLRELRSGVTWNPLNLPYKYYHGGKRTKAIEFANEMAKMIIDMDSTEDKFWTTTAVDIFTGFILRLFEEVSEEECHLKNLSELWNAYLNDRKRAVQEISQKYKGTIIYQKLAYLNSNSEKTVGSIEAFITMGLNKLAINEEFMQFLSMKGMDIEKTVDGKKAIYLIIPDENKSYHFIVSLFLEQVYEVLIRKAQQMTDGKLPVRMNFLIDEFANIPKIENMDAMITASRSRNIRFHLIVQGMEQLRHKYGEEAEVLSGNCNNWVYLYSKEFSLLQDISRLCGEVIYDNNVRMPLFSEFDLQHLSKEAGEALVLAGRSCPCLSNLADISEYPYPRLDIKGKIEVTEWKNLVVYKGGNENRDNYFLAISEEQKKRKNVFWEEKKKHWLVAVGPEHIIIADGYYQEMEILMRAPMGEMAYRLMKEEKIEPMGLEWYYAPEYMGLEYHKRLRDEPELVYLTLEELGGKHFVKLEGIFPEEDKTEYTRKYKLKVEMNMELLDGNNKVLYEEEIINYGGMLGLQYAYNKLFRKAAESLKGTGLEGLKWEEGSTGMRSIYFRKMLDDNNYALASIEEVREFGSFSK